MMEVNTCQRPKPSLLTQLFYALTQQALVNCLARIQRTPWKSPC